MHKLESKREVSTFTLLLTITYMVSYMTRTNFAAIVSEITEATGFSKSVLAVPLIGTFIAYGCGQLISGFFGDKISPKKLVSIGLLVSSVMNAVIPLCKSHWAMLAIWSVNGLAQAFLWPPMVRLMSAWLTPEAYKNTVTTVNCGGSIGTISIYLIAPVIIWLMGWQGVFWASAFFGIIMLCIWQIFAQDIPIVEKTATQTTGKGAFKTILSPLMFVVFFVIILMGMLREGITSWMPSFLTESFHLETEISILSSVLLPVFAILSIRFANWLYRRYIRNPLACATVLFGIGSLFAFALYLCCENNAVLSALCSSVLTGSVHGVNLMLIGMIPNYFENKGCVSTISGILNFFTYVGSAVATYGVAVLSEQIGWTSTIFMWFLAALAGSLICLLCIKPWKRMFS